MNRMVLLESETVPKPAHPTITVFEGVNELQS